MSDTAAQGGSPIPKDFPPVVYLPCESHVEDPHDAVVQMRETRDGRMALLVYSALDRLHSCCGEQQPWLVMPTAELGKLQEARHFDLVVLDVVIPEEHRNAGGAHA